MVDRIARDRYAELIRHFCAGLMTNREYEDRAAAIRRSTHDRGGEAVFWAVWGLYDDLRTHRLDGRHRVVGRTRRDVAKCILFLHSDADYLWPSNRLFAFAHLAMLVLAAFGLYWSADLRWYGPVAIVASIVACASLRIADNRRFGDDDAWPFLHHAELEEARRRPRLLAGR